MSIPLPPPPFHELPAGTRLIAGLGHSTVLADMDFETYSEAGFVWSEELNKWRSPEGSDDKGLGVVGVAVYAQHPSTEVLSLAYDLKDGKGPREWRPGMPNPTELFTYVGLVEAHNASFEWWIWNYVCTRLYGWPPLNNRRLRCSMAKSRAFGLPGALGNLASVLGVDTGKDSDGQRLLKKFSIPRDPTKKDPRLRILPESEPVDGPKLYGYNKTDIIAEAEVSALIPDQEGEELDYWYIDQDINQRGLHVDTEALDACTAIVNTVIDRYNDELATLTGGIKATELAQLQGWLSAHEIQMPNMQKETIDEKLKEEGLPELPRRALELRQAIGSASVKKVFSIRNQLAANDRLHNLFNYHAARTGRPTGEGPQPTNMPKAGPKVARCICKRHHALNLPFCPWCGIPCPPARKPVDWCADAAQDALEIIGTRSFDAVEYFFGQALLTVSGCLRGLFTPAPGHDFICSDFSAIEGVVAAQLAGEEWRLEVYRTHGKIYEMSASRTTGTPFEEMMEYKKRTGNHHPDRNKIGKFQELSLQFGGWTNAMLAFGAGEFLSDKEILNAVLKWRDASPNIVEMWGGQFKGLPWKNNVVMQDFGLEGCVVNAIRNPGETFTYRGISYIVRNNALFCRLPSGRYMTYQSPRLKKADWFGVPKWDIEYSTWNTDPKKGPTGWCDMNTYGGRLFENVVQATARDIQRYAQINLEAAGYPIVLHVYDENVAEVPEGFGSIEEFERIMATMPEWAQGWPIKATGGWRGKRYRKD